MIPYDIFRLAHAARRLTEEEEAERVRMGEYLANITQEPADDFPWQRWKDLSERHILGGLQEMRPSQRLFLAIKDGHQELEKAEEKLQLWPITDANVDAQNKLLSQIELKRQQLEAGLVMLDRMIADERELFGPVNTEDATALPVNVKLTTSAPKPHRLLNLCIGATEKERMGKAELINQMFEAAKRGVGYDAARYATAAVAVYKLAEYLKIIEVGTKATTWVPLLQEQYGVTVTEGRAKYSFNTPAKPVFIRAVQAAYEVYSREYPHKARGQQLPSGY